MIKYQLRNVSKEKGAALMILVFILALAMTTYILKSMNTQTIQVDHQQRVRARLNEAKTALIAWAVANPVHPGQMPYPDRSTDGNYDGTGDCGGNPAATPSLLVGQLPIYDQLAPCVTPREALGVDAEDGYGNRFWYVVSPNLVHTYSPPSSDPVINSDTMDVATWLRVLDQNGNLISDRVAAVIIAPGPAIGNQSRSDTASRANYLDTFQKNGMSYSNADYDSANEDFIMGADMSTVDDGDTSYTRPYLFNDQLVYITIDELMEALEKRVAREVSASLNAYYESSDVNPANRYYPYAAVHASPSGLACRDGQLFGQLPLASCSTADLSAFLPAWFTSNEWEKVIFYTLSDDCSFGNAGCDTSAAKLTVGSVTNVNALVITSGATLHGQTRPTAFLGDYLDSAENTDVNLTFDAVGTQMTNTYNDQMFIVEP